MIEPREAALIIIDMQNGFVDPASALCVAGALATVPACSRALDKARSLNMPVFHVVREYAEDGSDVEAVRHSAWAQGGKPVSRACANPHTLDAPPALAPQPGDRVMVKPRFSAFFNTNLDNVLRRLGVDTVVLIGTTTPNCIRTTCYDALSLEYNVAIVEDCTSSRSPAVQAANIEDMTHIGAQIITCEEFCAHGLANVRNVVEDVAAAVRAECGKSAGMPAGAGVDVGDGVGAGIGAGASTEEGTGAGEETGADEGAGIAAEADTDAEASVTAEAASR